MRQWRGHRKEERTLRRPIVVCNSKSVNLSPSDEEGLARRRVETIDVLPRMESASPGRALTGYVRIHAGMRYGLQKRGII